MTISTTGSLSDSLPSALTPRPHHPVLRRAPEALQFGVGPGGAVELSGGCPELRQLLVGWHGGQRVDDVVERAVRAGVNAAAVRGALAELHAAGALVDAAGPRRVAEARASSTALVTGNGPLVAAVAAGLALAGVGRIAVVTSGTVLAEDVGAFASSERGHPRQVAAIEAVRRVAPEVRCESGVPRGRLDLAVLTDMLHPARPSSLIRQVPHLVVRVVDGVGLIGPLVLPGRSACLRCIDLHCAERDSCWPTVAADLAGRVGSGSQATCAATAAIATEQALMAMDAMITAGPAPPTLDGVLELDTKRGTLRRHRWQSHPGCDCGAASGAPNAFATKTSKKRGITPHPHKDRASSGQEVDNHHRERHTSRRGPTDRETR